MSASSLLDYPVCLVYLQAQLTARLRKNYGPVQIHCFKHGDHDDGYAWIGFEEKESVSKAIKQGTPKLTPAEPPKEAKDP